MKTNTSKWGRILLGIFLIIYAVNQFAHLFPTGYDNMPEEAQRFLDSVVMYLPYLYILEAVIGLLLILDKWSAFILIVLFPLSVSFLIFTYANGDLTETWSALVVAALNIFLILSDKEKYKPLFE